MATEESSSEIEKLRQLSWMADIRVEMELDREHHGANPQTLEIGRRTLHRTRT